LADKIVFVVAEAEHALCTEVANLLKTNIEGAVVYTASEGYEAFSKMQNAPPRMLVTGLDLGKKMSGIELCQRLAADKVLGNTPVLVLSDVPDAPDFAEDRAKGRMKFLSMPLDKEAFLSAVRNMLQVETIKSNAFGTLKLASGDILFKEGQPADRAFLVKSGKLQASRTIDGQVVMLGEVLAGEFVGEMAHITGEPRSADVKALDACELIEIPLGTLDLLVFSKPTWTKALLKTLCRRLREANLKRK